jgi:hypothetical protein
MRFALSTEQRELAASVHALLSSADVPSVSAAWSGGDHEPGLDLLGKLAKIGVAELAEFPVELAVVFEELGRHAMPGPLIEAYAVAPALGLTEELTTVELTTVALPPHVPYALDADVATPYVVDGDAVCRAEVGAPLTSVDPTRRLFEVRPGEWAGTTNDDALDLGVLCQAAQLVGLGRGLLDRASEYVTQRRQFGRPIGEFQAVKHHLANVLVALEFARPLVHAAAVTGEARDISAARVAAADAAWLAARAALQVHGAIGYTREHALSWALLKVKALRSVWGTQTWHRRRVLTSLRNR